MASKDNSNLENKNQRPKKLTKSSFRKKTDTYFSLKLLNTNETYLQGIFISVAVAVFHSSLQATPLRCIRFDDQAEIGQICGSNYDFLQFIHIHMQAIIKRFL